MNATQIMSRIMSPTDDASAQRIGLHCPSPKQSPIKAMIAFNASLSSGPSVSSVMRLPLPAASIMTPMMLLAFTLRPLRASDTSHWYFAASCVNLADARACSPSLLTMSTSCCRINGIDLDVQYSVAAPADGFLDHRVQIPVAVSRRADEHGQIDTGNRLDSARNEQLGGTIARCCAVDLG